MTNAITISLTSYHIIWPENLLMLLTILLLHTIRACCRFLNFWDIYSINKPVEHKRRLHIVAIGNELSQLK